MSSETVKTRIVLLFGSGIDTENSTALAAKSSQLVRVLDDAPGPVDVGVISLELSRTIAGTSEHIRLDDTDHGLTDRLLTAVGAFALSKAFSTFPIGRLLNSLGPVSQGRVFWRTVKRNPEAMRLLRSADVAIATDVPTTKAAWLAVHRGWVADAHYDHLSASVGINWQLPSGNESPHE